MSRLGVQDIAIERLRISGNQTAAQLFARELESSSWPLQLPAHLQHAWVFVRELHVNGKPQQLRHNTAEELQQVLSTLVDAKHATANVHAVRFDSLPQLLAFLIKDLYVGQAKGKWYWQRWHHLSAMSVNHAITQLLIENIAELPAVIEQLIEIGQLPSLWNSLSSQAAETVVRECGRYYGFDVQSSSVQFTQHQIYQSVIDSFPKKSDLLMSWKIFFATPLNDNRWKIAAIVVGIKYCPMLVLKHPNAVINGFKSQLDDSASRLFNAKDAGEKSHAEQQHLKRIDNESVKLLDVNTPNDAVIPLAVKQNLHEKLLEPGFIDNKKSVGISSIENNFSADIETADSSYTEKLQILATEETYSEDEILLPACAEFFTQQGGFFYLINALRLVITADFLAEHLYAKGWCWWFDMVRLVAQRFDETLEASLIRFAAAVTNADDTKNLLEAPISEKSKTLFAQLDDELSNQLFWKKDAMSNSKFFSIPAHIMADASHIDIYFPLDAIRLDIRLAGLDVNAGWVPWLGRVVRFHYVDSPQLTAGKNVGGENAH